MILFHDILEKFIAPVALYGDCTEPMTVILHVIGADESLCVQYEYCSNDDEVGWMNSPFWSELFNLEAWLEHGVLESFWSGSAVVPEMFEIYKNGSGRCVECVLLWENPDDIDWNCILDILKYEEPDLYAKLVAFLKTEGVEYGIQGCNR